MSMLAMASPAPHAHFYRGYGWEETRQSDFPPSRPRSEMERIALPSIRQAFPELQLKVAPQEATTSAPSITTSPGISMIGVATPEYVHSPNSNKRRRLSIDDDVEERASRVPRLYESAGRAARQGGATSPGLAPPPRLATESWTSSSRSSPYAPSAIATMRSPAQFDHVANVETMDRLESRPMLPSMPMMAYEREAAQMPSPVAVSVPRVRGHSRDDLVNSNRPAMVHVVAPGAHGMEPAGPGYQQDHHPYPYHHPSRVQSLSLGAVHPFDRTPFSPAGYATYPDYARMGDFGGMGLHGDSKQRKRRGNLPKETTDKLRAWFHSHLNHPYPTEDEKQDLMRQTGLQMNQISNWFINARRRVLPGLQNNNRAVSDAMSSGRVTDGGRAVLPSTERSDYEDPMKHGSPISDDGTTSPSGNHIHHHHHHHFDDQLEDLKRRRAGHLKRGSV